LSSIRRWAASAAPLDGKRIKLNAKHGSSADSRSSGLAIARRRHDLAERQGTDRP